MSIHTTPQHGENAFLASLSPAIRARIQSGAAKVELRVRESLFKPKARIEYVYFPIDGAISNVYRMNDGSEVETGIIGREGMAGFPSVIMGGTSIGNLYTQIAGSAWKVPGAVIVDVLHEFPDASDAFFRFLDAQLGHFSQYGACNRLHSVDERFSRWLLMAHDRVRGDDIALTHEFLSLMLGVRRPAISLAAATLKRAGVIEYTRGNILIVDRIALQRSACECYDAVEDRFEQRLGYSIRKARLEPNDV